MSSFYVTWKKNTQRLGNAAGLDGEFNVDWGNDDLLEEIICGKNAQMKNAALVELLTDIGSELFSVDEDGQFCTEHGEGDFKRRLAKRINEAIGL